MQLNIDHPRRWLAIWLATALAYVTLGKLCLSLGTIGGTASPFWLPAGLVMALSLRLGYRVLPGIFLGELLVGVFFEPGPLWKHSMIAVGNVLEGIAVCYLAPRLMVGREPLDSVRNFFAFFASSAAGSSFNATLGVASLWLSGLIPLAAFGNVMLNWSIGDLGGALIVAPLILAWVKPDWRDWQGARLAEYAALLLATVAVTYAIFGDLVALHSAPLVFVLLPFLLWCSFRFGPSGVSLLNAVMIGMVIWGTTHGRGPFASASPTDSLILIQLFTSVLIVTALLSMIVNRDRQRMTEQLEAKVIERTLHLEQANQQLVSEISDRQRAEEALKQLNDTLEQRVTESLARNREKDHLLIQQSRLAAMGEMVGNIAHQWRQPLNALGLVLMNIKDAHDFKELDDTYIQRSVKTGNQLIQSMSKTIDDFRNFFRPNREKSEFSMGKAAADAVRLIEATFKHCEVEIRHGEMQELIVSGHPNELSQVLLNILNNARDAIQGRKVAHGVVDIRLFALNGLATLEIHDNGGGLDIQILPKIFDPYFTTKESGTGIGLYMSKMIMENMGGEITARNEESGAVFSITLPLVTAI